MCAVRWLRTQDPKAVGSPALALDPTTFPPNFLHAPLRAAFMTEKARPPTPSRAQGSHCCAPPLPANARWLNGRGPKSIRGAIMGGHNAHYGGRECPLAARWVLVGCSLAGFVALPPRYVARMLSAPRWGRAVSGLWAGRFYAGARPFPLPPRPPPPICVRLCGCVFRCSVVVVSIVFWWSVAVLGGPRSACVLRALARMPHDARCPPLPVPVRLLPALSVGAPPACPSWAPCGRSALNGHAGGAPSLSAWQ